MQRRLPRVHVMAKPTGKTQNETFERLVRETESTIRAYLAGIGVRSHMVDDVAQQVYLELYNHFDRAPKDAECIKWLKRVAHNRAVDNWRKWERRQSRHHEAIRQLLIEKESDADTSWLASRKERLRMCMQKLSPENRQLLSLRYWMSYTSRQISETMNMTAQAVRVRLFRVQQALRVCMTEERAAGEEAS